MNRTGGGMPRLVAPTLAMLVAIAAWEGAAATAAGPAPALLRVEVDECVLEAAPSQRGLLEDLARHARSILPRVEKELGARAMAPYRIVLLPPDPPDESLRALDAMAPPWAAGFLIPRIRVGAIRTAQADRYPHADVGSVLAHEATHMILHDAAGPGLPRWFGEGVATGIERSWGMRDVLVYSSSVLIGRLPPLAELDAAFDASDERARAAYAASFDFVLWSVKEYGDGIIRDIVRESRALPFPAAWEAATGVTLRESEAAWRRSSLLLYRWAPALTGTTALWSGITLLALLAAARRRARSRRILEAWDAEGREKPRPPDDPAPPDEDVH